MLKTKMNREQYDVLTREVRKAVHALNCVDTKTFVELIRTNRQVGDDFGELGVCSGLVASALTIAYAAMTVQPDFAAVLERKRKSLE